MAGTRFNITSNPQARADFLRGVVLLDQERPGITASAVWRFLSDNNIGLPMVGIEQELSTYDLYVLWHVVAMSIPMPPGNAAHSGPIFLPWHRLYMIRLEQDLQRVLNDPDFGLPYWDWAADGEALTSQQNTQPLWTDTFIGDPIGAVTSGSLAAMRVRLEQDWNGRLRSIPPRPLRRNAGNDPSTRDLPNKTDVQAALDEPQYDQWPWSPSAPSGHRNRLEGWVDGPALHNRVHVWIGGDMGPGTSPNDPVFFLNHCNVDRIWQAWMNAHGSEYAPGPGVGPAGHRLDSAMVAILGESMTPQAVLDPSPWYGYDTLDVVA